MIPMIIGVLGTIPQKLGKGDGRVGNWRSRGHYPNYSIVDVGQNTGNSPGDLKKLIILTLPKDHGLILI